MSDAGPLSIIVNHRSRYPRVSWCAWESGLQASWCPFRPSLNTGSTRCLKPPMSQRPLSQLMGSSLEQQMHQTHLLNMKWSISEYSSAVVPTNWDIISLFSMAYSSCVYPTLLQWWSWFITTECWCISYSREPTRYEYPLPSQFQFKHNCLGYFLALSLLMLVHWLLDTTDLNDIHSLL